MRKGWMFAATAAVLVVILVAGQDQQVFRYLDRRFEWTEAGRQAHFDLLWQQAEAEFTKMEGLKGDYPARAAVLKRPDLAVAALRTEIRRPWAPNFAADLMLYMERADLEPMLRQYLEGDQCNQFALARGLEHAFTPETLKQMALALPAASCRWAAFTAIPDRSADPAFMQAFVLKTQDISSPELAVAGMRVYDQLGRGARLQLVQWVGTRDVQVFAPGEGLHTLLDRETDPAVRQVILARMQDTAGLVAAIEQDGFYIETPPWGGWLQRAAAEYPDSFVARGIRAYEAVRGLPYFQIDWRFRDKQYTAWWLYGNHQYDPAREIPGWEAYLKEFSRHEGAGDAGYRLGRCYEIVGEYDKALATLVKTTTFPNAEMAWQARRRIVWILDAELDEPALRRLNVPELQGAIDYSIALHELRADRYADAVRDLDAVLARSAPADVDLAKVREQREQAARLAALAGKTDPQSRYDLAAIIYHNDLFAWAGGLAGADARTLAGDMDPGYARWEAESNHLIRAAEAFAALAGAPGAIGEQAAYSRAMALIRLAQSYDAGTALWKPRREIVAEAEALLESFVAAHPKGDLTDDALLSLGFLTREPAYFKRIRNEFPLSEVAAAARSAQLAEMPPAWRDSEWVPFRYLKLEEAPPEVAAWARDVLAQGGRGQLTVSGVTYLVEGAPKAGLNGTLNLTDLADGIVGHVQWAAFTPAEPYVLARVETSRPVTFR